MSYDPEPPPASSIPEALQTAVAEAAPRCEHCGGSLSAEGWCTCARAAKDKDRAELMRLALGYTGRPIEQKRAYASMARVTEAESAELERVWARQRAWIERVAAPVITERAWASAKEKLRYLRATRYRK